MNEPVVVDGTEVADSLMLMLLLLMLRFCKVLIRYQLRSCCWRGRRVVASVGRWRNYVERF